MRIVFLGSSSTDGGTYPLLVQQALATAGRPVPIYVNAGVGGHVLGQMRARLDRDVLAWAPDLVVLQTASNDVGAKVSPAAFGADLDAIAATLAARGVALLLLTPSLRGPAKVAEEACLAEYEAELRRVAAARGLRVAEAQRLMAAARARGESVIEADAIHPNFAGHRLLARAVLDALGYADVAVPERLAPTPLPGLLSPWRVAPLPDAKPLAAEAVAALAPEAAWATLELPATTPQEHWWREQIRQQGYALDLAKLAGPGRRFVAIATVTAPAASTRWLNVGAGTHAVWLNGTRVYRVGPEFRGYHAGRERLEVPVTAGTNTLVVETINDFFVSLTDTRDWD